MILPRLFILILLLMNNSCADLNSKKSAKKPPFAIIGYYVPEKNYHPETLPLDKLTHIIFAFSHVVNSEMVFKNNTYEEKLKRLVAQRDQHPQLKVMIACGGWGSDGFSEMAHTAKNRKKFVQSVLRFIKKYNLDGIDIDWEYPTIPAAGTAARAEDKGNFTRLMQLLRKELNTLKRPQTLSFAAAGWKAYYQNIELLKVMPYVDYINIMTYDLFGGNSKFTGHHTGLGPITLDALKSPEVAPFLKDYTKDNPAKQPRSAATIIQYCLSQGVRSEQIVIGAAFYGRSWQGVPPSNNGLYQSNKGALTLWNAYKNIQKELKHNKDFIYHWDTIAKAPYLYNAKDSIFVSYENPQSAKLKTAYAKQHHLGGIMFWELGLDTKGGNSLLQAIYNASRN